MPHLSPDLTATSLHTILGANGAVGRELSHALAAGGQRVRQVSRNPQVVHASDELHPADLLDARAADGAVAGSSVVYLLVGLPYDTAVWQAQWPRLMRNTIDACRRHRARLVFFDNVYAYGAVAGPMTEHCRFNPCSRKGEVRAAIATTLLDAMAHGELQALIARSADFYGAGARNSLLHAMVFERLRRGAAPLWIGDPQAWHDFTYTPDAGRALVALAQSDAAWGHTWHLPTSAEPMSGERMAHLACAQAGRTYRQHVLPGWLLRPMGRWIPALRENREMMYQLDRDYRFSSARIEQAFGLPATPYPAGIAAAWAGSA